jgi:hypothetical protein
MPMLHRYLTLCVEQQRRRLAAWKQLYARARAAQLRFHDDSEAHAHGCVAVTVQVIACSDLQPTHRTKYVSSFPQDQSNAVDQDTLINDAISFDTAVNVLPRESRTSSRTSSRTLSGDSSDTDDNVTDEVEDPGAPPQRRSNGVTLSSTGANVAAKQTISRRFRSRLDNFRSSAKATAQRAAAGELWRGDRAVLGSLCSPFVTVVHSNTSECAATMGGGVAVDVGAGGAVDERVIGRTNTEYRTVNPCFGSNANRRACEHSSPVQVFSAAAASTLVPGWPSATSPCSSIRGSESVEQRDGDGEGGPSSFRFYAQVDGTSGKPGFLHLLVSHERFGLNKGLTTVPMLKAMVPMDLLMTGSEAKGDGVNNIEQGDRELKLPLHPLCATTQQVIDGSAAVLGQIRLRVGLALPPRQRKPSRRPPPPPPMQPLHSEVATGTLIEMADDDNQHDLPLSETESVTAGFGSDPSTAGSSGSQQDTFKALERSNAFLRNWDLVGVAALVDKAEADLSLLHESINTCQVALAGKEPPVPGSPVAKLRARQEQQRHTRAINGMDDTEADTNDTRVMFKASQYKKQARAAGVPTNLHVSLYTIQVKPSSADEGLGLAYNNNGVVAAETVTESKKETGRTAGGEALEHESLSESPNMARLSGKGVVVAEASNVIKDIPPPIPPRPNQTLSSRGSQPPPQRVLQTREGQTEQVEVFAGVTCGVVSSYIYQLFHWCNMGRHSLFLHGICKQI